MFTPRFRSIRNTQLIADKKERKESRMARRKATGLNSINAQGMVDPRYLAMAKACLEMEGRVFRSTSDLVREIIEDVALRGKRKGIAVMTYEEAEEVLGKWGPGIFSELESTPIRNREQSKVEDEKPKKTKIDDLPAVSIQMMREFYLSKGKDPDVEIAKLKAKEKEEEMEEKEEKKNKQQLEVILNDEDIDWEKIEEERLAKRKENKERDENV